MSQIFVKANNIEKAIKRLRKKLEEEGFAEALNRHKFFMTKNERSRAKKKKAIHKIRKEQDGSNK